MAAKFHNRILVLGAGSVSQCVVPILLDKLVEPHQVTIVDFKDNRDRFASSIKRGATYVIDRLTKENMDDFLTKYLSQGDFQIGRAHV